MPEKWQRALFLLISPSDSIMLAATLVLLCTDIVRQLFTAMTNVLLLKDLVARVLITPPVFGSKKTVTNSTANHDKGGFSWLESAGS